MTEDALAALMADWWERGRCRVTQVALTPSSRLELTADVLGHPAMVEQALAEGWLEKGVGASVNAFLHPILREPVPIVLSNHDHITVEVPL